MDAQVNGLVPSEEPENEDLPLIPLSPAMDRSQRAKAMSQLSLHSEGSDVRDTTDAEDDDKPKDKKGEKPIKLHAACLAGNEAEVQSILYKGPDLNSLDKSGRTPLHNAILGRHVRIVECLLESGADPSILDESQDAPLHTAVKTGDENIVKVFLQRTQCDVDVRGHGSITPLHIAADKNKVNICKLLIEHGASPDCRNDDNMTPLTSSVEKGAKNAAEFFFHYANEKQYDMKSILYGVDKEGSTLLHLAVDSGNLAVVKLSLDNGALIRQPKESDKTTAFHLACSQGELEIVQLFASKDPTICRITLIDNEGLTPLHRAALNNHSTIVQYLIEQGASVDSRDKLCRTPLFLAAGVGATETVQLLIENGADVTIKDVDLRSSVRVAVGHTATMEVLLQKPEACPLIVDKDITGFAPVHYAAKHGHLQNIVLFIERNKAATSVRSDGLDTTLHGAARYGWSEIAEVLLSGRNIRSVNMKNNQGKTALHFACAEGHDRVVELLLRLGATVERDHNDRTALHIAAMRGSKTCIRCILQQQPECINLFDKNQNTALHLAAIYDQPDVVTILLSYTTQKILMNRKNQNVLDAAMKAERNNVALAIASHNRWREVMTSCSAGHTAQMQAFVIKMPEVAVRIMDQCITKKGNPGDKDYKITYDLSVIQGEQKPGQDPLIVLKTMLERRRLNCLTHPVCFIMMNTKWHTFGWKYLALNLILYLLLVIPLTALGIYSRANEKRLCLVNETLTRKEYINFDVPCALNDLIALYLQYGIIIITICLILKELLQLHKQRLKYLCSLSHYCDWICYGFALFYIFPPCDCKLGFREQIGAIALFIAWMNLILYLRRLSSYGQYIIMLTTMFVTLFKVLLLFFLFVMAFSSTFYLLLDEETEPYATFPYSMMTIFVMTLGELNYADIFMPWDKLEYATMTNILFFLFVLGMPIILMNMLVGLAVGDIDKIQVNALLDRYVMQVELVLDMEETLPSWLAKRGQVNKHVEYPNLKSSKLYEQVLGFSRPEGEEEEDRSPPALPPAFYPLLERIEEQEKKIGGIYEILKEQTELLRSMKSGERPSEEKSRAQKGIKEILPFKF